MPDRRSSGTLNDFFYGQGGGSGNDFINDALSGLLSGSDMAQVFGIADALGGDPGNAHSQGMAGLRAARRGLSQEGFRLRDEEDRRRMEALGLLKGGLGDFDKSFEDRERGLQGLQFSAAADQAGAGARSGLSSLRGLLGARGLGASSGAAAGLASNIALRQQGQIVGAKRDIALGAAQRAALHSAQRQQLLGGIANLTNQGPSMLGLDTLTNLHDSFAAQTAQGFQDQQNQKNRKAATEAAAIGAVGQVAGLAF